MENQTFDLGTILTVITCKVLTKIENVYKFLKYMTGEDIYTHQLLRVMDECTPVILRKYPQLSDVDVCDVNTDNWKSFLDGQIKKFGNEFEIEPIGLFEHRKIDPVEELEDLINSSDNPKDILIL